MDWSLVAAFLGLLVVIVAAPVGVALILMEAARRAVADGFARRGKP